VAFAYFLKNYDLALVCYMLTRMTRREIGTSEIDYRKSTFL